eukprot:gene25631-11289_t
MEAIVATSLEIAVAISDFGLSVALDVNYTIKACNYGTLTHMPPETLVQGTISKATDVYSFGVLMWQMYTCSRPWCGLTDAQIVMQGYHWPAS